MSLSVSSPINSSKFSPTTSNLVLHQRTLDFTAAKTPKERAEAYAIAANKDWFHKRTLHAEMMNTVQLAQLLHVSVQQILDTVNSQSTTAEDQMNALRDLIEGVEFRRRFPQQTAAAPALSPAGYPADVKQNPESTEVTGPSSASSSKAPERCGSNAQWSLHISAETLWLVLRRDNTPEVPAKPGA